MNTREVIPRLLKLFQRAEIHATWATVGLLMHENKKELVENIPSDKPTYKNQKLSAYRFMKENSLGQNEEEDPLHFADSLIRQIISTPHQELASHSFAHYYCNEPGQELEQFRADTRAIKSAAARYGVELKSLVFPRNQFNSAYLEVCADEGFKAVRSNPSDWWWNINSTEKESSWKRLSRMADAYVPLGNTTSYSWSEVERDKGVFQLPASRLLRPYNPRELFFNDLKIRRIKAEMTHAAKHQLVYHLWWHPHNFGNFPSQNLEGLIDIINHFLKLKQQYDFRSYSMAETAEILEKNELETT